MSRYQNLVDALKACGIPFQEWAWDQRPGHNYGVISLDGAGETLAGDQKIEYQAPEGTVDLFTYNNDRSAAMIVQETMNQMDGCAWRLNSVQYEQDPRLIHWEWVFQLEDW